MVSSQSVCPHQFPPSDADDIGPVFEQDCHRTGNRAMRESGKLTNEDVSRIFGLPAISVFITELATFSNTEQESRVVVQNAIRPQTGRIEAISRCLFNEAGRRTFTWIPTNPLRSTQIKARRRQGREKDWGVSPNTTRRKENEAADRARRRCTMAPRH